MINSNCLLSIEKLLKSTTLTFSYLMVWNRGSAWESVPWVFALVVASTVAWATASCRVASAATLASSSTTAQAFTACRVASSRAAA